MSSTAITVDELIRHQAAPASGTMARRRSAATSQTAQTSLGLSSQSFLGLLVTQFLGALNDNMFRWLVIPIGKNMVGPEYTARALAAGLACFVLPYMLLAAPAGYLADRFNKQRVMVVCKVAEVVIMALGVYAIFLGNIYFLFFVVFLMGSQSALFSPSKYGSLPEMLPGNKLSSANGIIGATTLLAVVMGTIAGTWIYGWTGPAGMDHLWISATALLGVAGLGLLASLWIQPLKVASPNRRFPVNPASQVIRDLAHLGRNRAVFGVALGVAFFWLMASLSKLNIDAYAMQLLDLSQQEVGYLLAVLMIGVALGNLLAGILSAGKVELGLVTVGAGGMAVGSIALFLTSGSVIWTGGCLLGLGISAGLFSVPLESYLQQNSPADSRGAILAASNFLTFGAMFGVSGLFWILSDPAGFHLAPHQIFLVCGLATLAVAIYCFRRLPAATIRFVVWLMTLLLYRRRVEGVENLPREGGAILVSNHVSWADAVLLTLSSPRTVRMIGYAPYTNHWSLRWLSRTMGVIPIMPGSGRQAIGQTLKAAADAARDGDLVCIFPEGGITRDGKLGPFKPGVMSIIQQSGVPVIPVYLNGLWGSIFSYSGKRLLLKRPRRWPYPVTVTFDKPLCGPESLDEVRNAVKQLEEQSMNPNHKSFPILPRAFLRQCRSAMFRSKLADSGGQEMTGGSMLMRSIILSRLLRREVLSDDEKFVGVLIPPTAGAVLVNAALPLMRRVAVNLNYTVSSKVMNSCIAQCNIKHVLTSRRVMEKLNLEIDAELVYLEDLILKVSLADKLVAAAQSYLTPVSLLERIHGLHKIQPDDLLTVLFTSGSTGEPKGVMLTQRNVGSNIQSIDDAVILTAKDTALGVLPFFHSYGYTATLWTMLALPPRGVYHFSPLEAKPIGKLAKKYDATILMATPTFLRTYLKRCAPDELSKLEIVFASAERLPKELSDAFESKFGVRPKEAYGATELSPLGCVNVPEAKCHKDHPQGSKEGTVGRPIPGVRVKTIDVDTGENLPPLSEGMLLFTGDNVMLGYMDQPEQTAKVIRDGWYVTGDIGMIDEEGFVRITGRLSRFSKIGGEMVPHIKIEETLQGLMAEDEEQLVAAVTAVSDDSKGERLVVLHTAVKQTPREICKKLAEAGLPNLWIPSPDSFVEVDELPVLGTGKLDLKALKERALELFGQTTS